MKVLIIGGAGFAGGYLIRELVNSGWEVHATHLPDEKINTECFRHVLDVLRKDDIKSLIDEIKPDIIYHLAAQSSVALSWKKPQLTAEINIIGSINVMEALPDGVRLILIGSGEEYGFIRENACPIRETENLNPANIYAVSKACAGMIGRIYHRAYGKDIIIVRAFNHSGAGQAETFVISDFCKQIAEIENGLRPPEICTGNLSAQRDFTDVRDIVRAYRLLGENGISGKTYNVGRGKAVSIEYILNTALSLSAVTINHKIDPERLRASDIPIIEPDTSEIFSDTGWTAEISIEKTISDTLDYWREKIKKKG
ncbi:MAG: GDP-mannose 4,6-dehydratase [Prevotella sp.]|nr:GDP-mannose 4,6-dehydratase [Alistipes senegalensis]MCM1357067.1 GDP-mannose 4,6-dehydratase [Prevotella sp.]MCM1473098.1 GDP-mannose 4,6-dehydratase [Muribaculaceae bacterium]